MRLESLKVEFFRNLTDLECVPHRVCNVFWGDNGHGKTNLLEAIYLLGATESFRANKNAELVGFEAETARVSGRIARGNTCRRIQVSVEDGRKNVTVDGIEQNGQGRFFRAVNVILFHPEHLQIVKGRPGRRRTYLNDAASSGWPAYRTNLEQYGDVLAHRNSLLKEPQLDESLFEVYTEQLAHYGAKLVEQRRRFLELLRPHFSNVFAILFGEGVKGQLRYELGWGESPDGYPESEEVAKLESFLKKEADKRRSEERERGYTLIGPHRDDVGTYIDGQDARTYGSQGQQRLFVLTMKLAELTLLSEEFHITPLLLLDDVLSELDSVRRHSLMTFLTQRQRVQSFITTTDLDVLEIENDRAVFRIESGAIASRSDPDNSSMIESGGKRHK